MLIVMNITELIANNIEEYINISILIGTKQNYTNNINTNDNIRNISNLFKQDIKSRLVSSARHLFENHLNVTHEWESLLKSIYKYNNM